MPDLTTTDRFVFFWNGWPSQWHPSPFEVRGIQYSCAEQYMMAEKARVFGDREREQLILEAAHPRIQKQLGRQVVGFDEHVWKQVCLGVVFVGSLAKYSASAELLDKLLATAGKRLVEASPKDRVWGIGLAAEDPRAHDERSWQGTNYLGIVLDRVRDHLLAGRGVADPCQCPRVAPQIELAEQLKQRHAGR